MGRGRDRSGPAGVTHALILGLSVLAVGLLTLGALPTGVWHDDGVYLMLGHSLAEGRGLAYGGVLGDLPAPKFPPAYPLLVGGVLALFPAAITESLPFAVVNVVLVALAATILGLWARRSLPGPTVWVAAAVVVACLPGVLWSVVQVALSEPLFLLALVVSLYAAFRIEERDDVDRRWVGLFLSAAALAFFTRTVGIVIPAAMVLSLVLSRRLRLAALLAVASAFWVLPWTLWSRGATDSIPAPLRDVLGAYGSWWIDQIQAAPDAYSAHLPRNAVFLLQSLAGLVVPGARGTLATVLAVVLTGCGVVGLVVLWRRSRFALLLIMGYLGLVWLWPFSSARLLAPIAPVWVLLVLSGPMYLARGGSRMLWRGLAVTVALVSLVLNASGLLTGRHRTALETRARALDNAMTLVEGHVPAGATVGAPEFWASLGLHTQAQGVPSARFLPLQTGAPSWGSPEQQFALWDAAGLDYVLLEQAGGVHGAALDALEGTCPGAVRTIAVEPGLILARLDWDPACRARVLPGRT